MIETSNNGDELARRLAEIAPKIGAGLKRALDRAGAFHKRTVSLERFTGYTGTSTDKLQTRSGGLKRSVGWATRGEGLASELTIFAKPPARIQEFGGTITAKNRRYLTIPLRAALTPTGQLKGGARITRTGNRWGTADGWATFVLKARSGKLFIARRRDNGSIDLLYKLQQSVRIPARFGFRDHFRTRTVPFLKAEFGRLLA